MFRNRTFLATATVALTAQFFPGTALASTPERLTAATATVNELSAAPDKSIPADLLKKAECIIVVPSLKSGAIVVGGEYRPRLCVVQDRKGVVCAGSRQGRGRQRRLSDRRR